MCSGWRDQSGKKNGRKNGGMKNRIFGGKMDQTFYKKLAGLMFPIVFQNLMLASVAVADAIMLGSVEQNSMAAVSLATQIQFIQNMFLGAIVASVAILGAQYWGKGDQDTLNDILLLFLLKHLFFSYKLLSILLCLQPFLRHLHF